VAVNIMYKCSGYCTETKKNLNSITNGGYT
jgi:hypothetical protein